MALLKVARLGNPVLTRVAEPVSPEEIAGTELQRLIEDMVETMVEERGIGLAAPQVHRSIRLFVMDAGGDAEAEDVGEEEDRDDEDADDDDADDEEGADDEDADDDDEDQDEEDAASAASDEGTNVLILVNPVLSFPSERKMRLWEGCLSIPGLRGPTERFAEVVVDCLDEEGRPQRHLFRGLPAAVAQHENDHLDGIFFLQRMPDLARLSFEDELGRHPASPERRAATST